MKHIFYAMTIFPIIWEIWAFSNSKKLISFKNKLMIDAKTKGVKLNSEQATFSFLQMLYVFWVFIGFFTFQWPIFFAWFFISLVPKQNYIYVKFDAILSLFVLFFIIINSYHLHIDVFSYIKNYFN